MYLSKLHLNPRSSEARRDARSPYQLHRTLAHAFPTSDEVNYREKHQVLFRSELNGRNSPIPGQTLLVQSQTEPLWQALPTGYTVSPPQTKSVELSFATGQECAFRLVANPTRKVKRPGSRQTGRSQGKRVALPDYTSEHFSVENPTAEEASTPARAWLDRQGERHGFRVRFVLTEGSWLGRPNGKYGDDKNSIPIYRVRYEGLLTVTDAEKLHAAITQGIGPAKAFGCGLLSLARPR